MNQLSTLVKESGLETTKAQFILDNFEGYFKIASEWEKKARTIVITDKDQKAEMKMAREGRLFLREKRIAIEKARKELKDQSLREGKAIDGIANVLKALIVPIEEYLDDQEKFVERKEAEAKRIKDEDDARTLQAIREKEEQAEQAERERINKENIALRKEVEEKELAMQKEREESAWKQAELQAELQAQAQKEKDEKDRLRLEKEDAEAKVKRDAELAQAEVENRERNTKYQNFLASNNYSEETKQDFHLTQFGNTITLYKKVGVLEMWTDRA